MRAALIPFLFAAWAAPTNTWAAACASGDTDGDGVDDVDEDVDESADCDDDDTDRDGTANYLDTDDDGDTVLTIEEGGPEVDTDSDGTPDYLDTDSDADRVLDRDEVDGDSDSDGADDRVDDDDDDDGYSTQIEGDPTVDTDSDGTPDYLDTDSDADSVPDIAELDADTDSDGADDRVDNDDDGDGVPTRSEGGAGVDSDGDGIPDYLESVRITADRDGDGAPPQLDCDEDDDSIFVGAPEIPDDDIDQNCDGIDALVVQDLVPGDLVISEVMHTPQAVDDDAGEWFEVINLTSGSVDLGGLVLHNDSAMAVVVGPLEISAGGAAVFARSADASTNGGVPVDYAYGDAFSLDGAVDSLGLSVDTSLADPIDVVSWDPATWPVVHGATLTFEPSFLDQADPHVRNDEGAWWCPGRSVYGDGDLGTPRSANDSCADQDGDGDGSSCGCSSGSSGMAWLGVPLVLMAWRRRETER